MSESGTDQESERDLRAEAAVLAAMKLGITVPHEHLSRALGAEASSPSTWPRVSGALLELLAPRLIDSNMRDAIRDQKTPKAPEPPAS